MTDLSTKEKLELITRNLQEVLKENIITDVLEKEQRPLKIYWGILPLFAQLPFSVRSSSYFTFSKHFQSSITLL